MNAKEEYRRAAGDLHAYPIENEQSVKDVVESWGLPLARTFAAIVGFMLGIVLILIIASIVLGGK